MIAQPKSASTSLAKTIAKIGKLYCNLGVPYHKGDMKCKGFSQIQEYHDNMSVRSQKFLQQIINGKKTLFKEHLLPTDGHLRKLEKIRKPIIILLRSPEDSFDSYKRLFESNKKKYNKENLLKEIEDFHNRYMWWDSRQGYTKIIYYQDLILNYQNTMKNILKWYGIKYKKIIPLLKLKYTGIGIKRLKNVTNS
jgi:hypothetical protein